MQDHTSSIDHRLQACGGLEFEQGFNLEDNIVIGQWNFCGFDVAANLLQNLSNSF